jgi:predicted DNA-binding transcriptional regulator AlpA
VSDEEKRELLTIPQAAAELDLTRATLWKHIKSGRLTGAQQLGGENGVWVIDRDVLDAFKATRPPRLRKPGPKPHRPT